MRRFDPWGLLTIAKDVAVLLISAGAATWAWFRTRHAHSGLSTQATIVGTRVQSNSDSPILPWAANLTYTYVVNGEYYSGFHRIRARSKRRAEEKIEGWKGRMVVARYSPDKHDLSALLKGDQPGGQLGN
jgi:predicted DNA-binding helix-hairpin-helix protein